MEIRRLDTDAPDYDPEGLVARPYLEGRKANVRVIRLGPGQFLPPHTHGESELMLFVVEGEGRIGADADAERFAAGDLAYLTGDEELFVTNTGTSRMTLMAVLAPPFPPR